VMRNPIQLTNRLGTSAESRFSREASSKTANGGTESHCAEDNQRRGIWSTLPPCWRAREAV